MATLRKGKQVADIGLEKFKPLSSYLPGFTPTVSSSATTIDGKTIHSFATFEVDASFNQTSSFLVDDPLNNWSAIFTGVEFRCTAASGVTVPASASFGLTTVDDLISNQSLLGLTSAGTTYNMITYGKSLVVSPGSLVTLTLTAAVCTSQTLQVNLFGFAF